jgi:hypothetical protein
VSVLEKIAHTLGVAAISLLGGQDEGRKFMDLCNKIDFIKNSDNIPNNQKIEYLDNYMDELSKTHDSIHEIYTLQNDIKKYEYIQSLFKYFEILNDIGCEEAMKRVHELTQIEKYTKEDIY